MQHLIPVLTWQKQVEAALKGYDFYGEPPNIKRKITTMYGMDKGWVRIAKRAEPTLRKVFGRIKFDINLTFVLTNKAYLANKEALFFEDRYLKPQEIKYLTKQGIIKGHDARAINIIFTGSGTDKEDIKRSMILPPTPWIVIHRIMQPIVEQYGSIFSKDILTGFNHMVDTVYGKGFYLKSQRTMSEFQLRDLPKSKSSSMRRRAAKNKWRREDVYSALFTFGSARTRNLESRDEALVDLAVYTIYNKMNPTGGMHTLPAELIGFKRQISEKKAAEIQRKYLSMFKYEVYKYLSKAEGRYLVV